MLEIAKALVITRMKIAQSKQQKSQQAPHNKKDFSRSTYAKYK